MLKCSPLCLQEGEEWSVGEKCVKYKCVNGDNGLQKIKQEYECDKTCSPNFRYVEPSPGSENCCGHCNQVACEENGNIYDIGQRWTSEIKKCYDAEYAEINGVIQIVHTTVCKSNIENCPKDQIILDETGCCQICRLECNPRVVPPDDTNRMFYFNDKKGNYCYNTYPLHNVTVGSGKCLSEVRYDYASIIFLVMLPSSKCILCIASIAILNEAIEAAFDLVTDLEGEEWSVGEKCVKYKCVNGDNGLQKIKQEYECDKTCSPNFRYVEPSPGSENCRGHCNQVACEENGNIYDIGQRWTSEIKKCYDAEYAEINGVIQIVHTTVCKSNIENCPKDQIILDETGCCQICRLECNPRVVPPDDTNRMFYFNDKKGNYCYNTYPLHNVTVCSGKCLSEVRYDYDTDYFDGMCR
ncbi:hemocytin-like [Centruroides sculpturatus]|uniref:hemocytin-like n=1 Tax=Centruroides sculpturatus TaxID=218467 RepID=UPI000C6E98F9|nr:hemocytin-like [Centruroides sculpturatus]